MSILSVELGDSAGVGWFSPTTFAALKRHRVPVVADCETWDEWWTQYQHTFMQLKAKGLMPYKIVVAPKPLAQWLRDTKHTNDSEGWCAYVVAQLTEMLDGLR